MNCKILKIIVSTINFFLSTGILFSQIVINEIMYTPAPSNNEWFEIYNKGNNSINIKNWKWKDATAIYRTITNQSIIVNPNSFAVVCQDSVLFRSSFPNVQGIVIQSIGWSQLNNTGNENVIIFDSTNQIIDSLLFNNSWGGTGGFSLERINPQGLTNLQTNWSTCIDISKGTPNRTNSVTPKLNDLILKSFDIFPSFPKINDTLNLKFLIKNSGLNPANNFTLNIFKDLNFDSIPQPAEIINTNNFSLLNPNDSIYYNYHIPSIDSGLKQYIGKIIYPPDEDTLNNKLVKSVFVGGYTPSSGIVINEILYDPGTGKSEWFEIYNTGNVPINLQNWKWKDAAVSNPARTLTTQEVLLNPGTYAVVCEDSSNLKITFPNISGIILQSNGWNALNNTGYENIVLYNSFNQIVDSITYSNVWGGSTGTSLEKRISSGSGNDSTNWGTCIDIMRATPNRINSLSNITPALWNDIVINEIMYDPLTGNAEWVEIFNRTNNTIVLSGWRFSESNSFYNFFDSLKYKINPGAYFILSQDSTIYTRFPFLKDTALFNVVFNKNISLSNTGETVKITDPVNTIIDSVVYSPKWHNPNISDPKGISLERINPNFNSNDRYNWNSCANYLGGTPGTINSIYTENLSTNSKITVSPNPFSPDGDGFEDFTVINYTLTSKISQIRLKVYDVKGRLVRTLAGNQTSGSTGQIIFDGKDDGGQKLRIGIYILYLEAVNDQNGIIDQAKTTVVIATKL
ncbi:MAG: hypothetical protein FJ216_05675 [Ignavibacteria bacterium]|nr:hypothetical protein [Ignavibacteria bacterium]